MQDTSRDPELLYPALKARWEWMRTAWIEKYPDLPVPFLTATFRGPISQEAAFKAGKSRNRFGESLHNFKPAYAFDVAFPGKEPGTLDWSFHLFQKWGELGETLGLEWGGRFPGLVDGPHLQLPMTVDDALRGLVPALPPLSALDDGWMVVMMTNGKVEALAQFAEADDVVVRYSASRKRIYLDVKEASS